MKTEERKMMLFMLGIVAGIALCCLVEFLYAHFCPFAQEEDKVKNWEGKRGKYGVGYKHTTTD
jgi:hypothetical protein